MRNQTQKIPALAGMRNQWSALALQAGGCFGIVAGLLTSGCGLAFGLEDHVAPVESSDAEARVVESGSSEDVGVVESGPSEDGGSVGQAHDEPDASDGGDAAQLICEPYSCSPSCGACEAGTSCGNGGAFVCGSSNCTFWNIDAGSYSCPSDSHLVFKCAHYPGANTKDVMPRCLARGGSTSDGEFTYWCCPGSF